MCLSLDVGSIYAPVVVLPVEPLYRQTMHAHIPCDWTTLGVNYRSRAIPIGSQHG